jgi:hypothetical protein
LFMIVAVGSGGIHGQGASAKWPRPRRREWKAGMRKECLEWEVRDAILNLWKKGYTTYYSGYRGNLGLQVISFVSLEPLSEEVQRKIWGLTDETGLLTWSDVGEEALEGGILCNEFNGGRPVFVWGLKFVYTGGDPKKIKEHWDRIADLMPDLGWQQLASNSGKADRFRGSHTLQEQPR